jgi:ubiquinone/menaquinone biosynthesis C-methylase UbiE
VDDGYKTLVGADISRVALRQMKSRTADYPEIEYFQGNMMDTDLPEKSFDAIIDKGLFDSILCNHLGEVECNILIQEVS